jgi:N-formylglutamate deformylase
MAGHEPDEPEIAARIDEYWRPYHDRIASELAELRTQHGRALLWDAHSIASEIPGLFAGVLPEFNFGTRDGEFGAVLDGRFKGGYITQHYGKPANGVYAVQLELARRCYMSEAAEQVWDAQRAQRAQALISRLLSKYLSH